MRHLMPYATRAVAALAIVACSTLAQVDQITTLVDAALAPNAQAQSPTLTVDRATLEQIQGAARRAQEKG